MTSIVEEKTYLSEDKAQIGSIQELEPKVVDKD